MEKSPPRIDLQLENFHKALGRLKEALAEDESDFVRDSIIQRFEFTFEMAWKTMFRYLADKGDDVAPKPWSVLPVAFEVNLIGDPDAWEQMRKYRDDASHEYNQAKAIEIAAFIRNKALPALETFAKTMDAAR